METLEKTVREIVYAHFDEYRILNGYVKESFTTWEFYPHVKLIKIDEGYWVTILTDVVELAILGVTFNGNEVTLDESKTIAEKDFLATNKTVVFDFHMDKSEYFEHVSELEMKNKLGK